MPRSHRHGHNRGSAAPGHAHDHVHGHVHGHGHGHGHGAGHGHGQPGHGHGQPGHGHGHGPGHGHGNAHEYGHGRRPGHAHAHSHAHPSERTHHRPSAAELTHNPADPNCQYHSPSYEDDDRYQPPGHIPSDREIEQGRRDMLRAGYTEEEIDMDESSDYDENAYHDGAMGGHGHSYGHSYGGYDRDMRYYYY